MPQEITILSGERGTGKTTTCLQLVETARQHSLHAAGVICPARWAAGRKVGIDLMDVRTGERWPLAEADQRPASLRTPAYRFHQKAIDWGTAIIKNATPCTLLIIDELGPLELVRGLGWASALEVLAAGRFEQAVVVVRPLLIPRFYEHLPGRPGGLIMLPGRPDLDPVTTILAELEARAG